METKRATRRVKADLQCTWGLTDACPRNGKITSLSLRGCFIKTTAVTTDGQTIFVNCWLPERRWMMFSGTVIYHLDKIGFGMLFTDFNEEQKQAVAALMEQGENKLVK